MRESLVIATAPAAVTTVSVASFGAVPDGTSATPTDNTVAVQRAIDAAAAAAVSGAGTVLVTFGLGVYGLGSDVVVSTPGVFLQGAFTLSGIYQGAPTAGTVLKRIGATAGDVVRFATPTGSATGISGDGLQNIAIDGNNTAAIGLHLHTVQWSTFADLHIRNCTTALCSMDVDTNIGDGVEDNQGNIFERISGTQIVSTGGHGFVLDGTAPFGNTSLNTFNRISIRHVNGVAFRLLNCDSNVFTMCSAPRTGGGTGIGLEFVGSTGPTVGVARSNTFIHFDAGPGGVTSRAGTGGTPQPAVNNWLVPYSLEQGAPVPVIEAGSTLWWTDNQGNLNARSIALSSIQTSGVAPTITPFTGSPNGGLTAIPGSVAIRTDSNGRGCLQVKGSGTGNAGWQPVHVEGIISTAVGVTASQATTLVDASGGARTITLPSAVGIDGKIFRVKKIDASANVVSIATTSAQTIEGAASPLNLAAVQWAFATLQSDGANWIKV